MAMRYRIRHATHYRYESEVMHSHHLLHLVPRPAPYQQCLEHSVEIEPAGPRHNQMDAFGNPVIRIELAHPHRELSVVSQMQIEVYPRPVIHMDATLSWQELRDSFSYHGRWPGRDQLDAARFRHESPHVRLKQAFSEYASDCFPDDGPFLRCANSLNAKLHRELSYSPGTTTTSTATTEVLKRMRGVCQDFAHLMIACMRSRGLPARYVSGYLRTSSPGDAASDRRVGADASHAWVSVWCPPYGWVEFDPTNGCFAGVDHVAVAWGRDFGDVSPLRGVILGGSEHQLDVTVSVEVMKAAAAPDKGEPSA